MLLEHAIDIFLMDLRFRGYSERTIHAYSFDLEKFCIFLEDFAHKTPESMALDDLDIDMFRVWLDRKIKDGNSIKTIARKAATLRAFFKFLYKEGKIKENPTERLKIPRIPKKPPEALSQEEIRQLIMAVDPEDKDFLLDRAVLVLLYSTGLRVGELANLNLEHINLERQHIRVPGKGAKERILPLQDTVRKALLDYLLFRENEMPESLAPGQPALVKRSKSGISPVNVRKIQYIVEKHGKKAGILSHMHPHLLRHSIATHLIEEGANVEAVRQTLGHEDLATTSIYLKASSKYLRQEHEKYNPLDKLLKDQ